MMARMASAPEATKILVSFRIAKVPRVNARIESGRRKKIPLLTLRFLLAWLLAWRTGIRPSFHSDAVLLCQGFDSGCQGAQEVGVEGRRVGERGEQDQEQQEIFKHVWPAFGFRIAGARRGWLCRIPQRRRGFLPGGAREG